MNKLSILSFSGILILFLLPGCRNEEKKFAGESYINYPDVRMLLRDNLESYESSALKFQLLKTEDGKKSSATLTAQEMPWQEIKNLFLQSDINSEKFDGKFSINVSEDSNTFTTLNYSCLDPQCPVRMFTLQATRQTGHLYSMYIDYKDIGFLSQIEYKILYINGKLLQIQEWTKMPFRSRRYIQRMYTFITS
ncbi:MAG: hypothetical protein JNM44_02900 [Chitinophagaceae bacterium]|nr:hypothetical protein [Chitinophagaceae bacterium]